MLTLGFMSCNSSFYRHLHPQCITKPNVRYQLELMLQSCPHGARWAMHVEWLYLPWPSPEPPSIPPLQVCIACVWSHFSCVCLFATLWTVAYQAPLSMVSREKCWSGLPCPSPGNLPNPGIKPTSLMSSALTCRFFTSSGTWETPVALMVPYLPGPHLQRVDFCSIHSPLTRFQMLSCCSKSTA